MSKTPLETTEETPMSKLRNILSPFVNLVAELKQWKHSEDSEYSLPYYIESELERCSNKTLLDQLNKVGDLQGEVAALKEENERLRDALKSARVACNVGSVANKITLLSKIDHALSGGTQTTKE